MPFALCVAGGGFVWAWLYDRTQSLYAPWISHLLIDAALMAIGYEMVALLVGVAAGGLASHSGITCRFLCPGGTAENSPAFQRWDLAADHRLESRRDG